MNYILAFAQVALPEFEAERLAALPAPDLCGRLQQKARQQ